MAWNPSQYLKFGMTRLRPAVDLLNAAVAAAPKPECVSKVLDLGIKRLYLIICGYIDAQVDVLQIIRY
jgi:trans-aconitate methyltransferase